MDKRTRSWKWATEEIDKLMAEYCEATSDPEAAVRLDNQSIQFKSIGKESDILRAKLGDIFVITRKVNETAIGKSKKEWKKTLELTKMHIKMKV